MHLDGLIKVTNQNVGPGELLELQLISNVIRSPEENGWFRQCRLHGIMPNTYLPQTLSSHTPSPKYPGISEPKVDNSGPNIAKTTKSIALFIVVPRQTEYSLARQEGKARATAGRKEFHHHWQGIFALSSVSNKGKKMLGRICSVSV